MINDWIVLLLWFYYDLGPKSLVRLPTYLTTHLSNIFFNIELLDKNYSYFRYPIYQITMMINNSVVRLKSFYFSTFCMSDIIPSHWSPKNFSIFYTILIFCLYLKTKNHLAKPAKCCLWTKWLWWTSAMMSVLIKESVDIKGTSECGSCGFTLKRVRDKIRTYSQMHRTDKYSQHSSII